MRNSLYIVCLLLLSSLAIAQNRVETKSGTLYNGTIIKNAEDSLVILTADSVLVSFPKTSISTVQYDVPTADKGNFWSLGATFGTPAAIQLVGAYDFERLGVRLSAGYIGKAYGFQINALRKFSRSDHFSHELSLIGGYSYLDGPDEFFVIGNTLYVDRNLDDWLYAGVAYSLHFYGAFAELGLSVGDGTFSNPQLLFQIGYLYEFR